MLGTSYNITYKYALGCIFNNRIKPYVYTAEQWDILSQFEQVEYFRQDMDYHMEKYVRYKVLGDLCKVLGIIGSIIFIFSNLFILCVFSGIGLFILNRYLVHKSIIAHMEKRSSEFFMLSLLGQI